MNYSWRNDHVPEHAFGIMLHHFHRQGERPTGQGSITPDQFESLLDHLGRRVVSAHEWLELLRAGKLTDQICITFDDALKCQAQIAAPILEARGLTGMFFAYTAMLDRSYDGEGLDLEAFRYFRCCCFDDIDAFYDAFETFLSERQQGRAWLRILDSTDTERYLCEYDVYSPADRRFRCLRNEILPATHYRGLMYAMMADHRLDVDALRAHLWMGYEDLKMLHDQGNVLGLHSHTHPTQIEKLDHAKQAQEYQTNKRQLESIAGAPITVMSHPSNSYTDQTLKLLRDMDVTVGFRADHQNGFALSSLELPRVNHSDLIFSMERVA